MPQPNAPSLSAACMPAPGAQGVVDAFTARYHEVRRLARARLASEQAAISTGTLVHELYLQLCQRDDLRFDSREQLLAYAGQAMRRLLVDMARHRLAQRRQAQLQPMTEDDDLADAGQPGPEQQLAMHQALQRLAAVSPRLARVAEARALLGLSVDEAADALGTSAATVKRDWWKARAFLLDALGLPDADAP